MGHKIYSPLSSNENVLSFVNKKALPLIFSAVDSLRNFNKISFISSMVYTDNTKVPKVGLYSSTFKR